MSLGAWKTPHTKTPGLLVLTGVKGEVWAKRVLGLTSTPRVLASLQGVRRGFQAHRQDHHIEVFGLSSPPAP
jgi:hypothetical protein